MDVARDHWELLVTVLEIQASQVGLVEKNQPANAGERKRREFNPWIRKTPRGRHGSSFQSSCLENSMDRGAWRAAVHRVTWSQTRLKQLSMHV